MPLLVFIDKKNKAIKFKNPVLTVFTGGHREFSND